MPDRLERPPSLRKSLLINGGITVLCVLLLIGLLGLQCWRVWNDSRWVLHSVETRRQAGRIESLAKQMESGERGYLITLQPWFERPYLKNRAKIDDMLARLQANIHDPTQIERIRQVRADVKAWDINAQEEIRLRTSGDPHFLTYFSQAKGAKIMLGIVDRMEAFLSAETALLQQRQLRLEKSSLLTAELGAAIIVCLLAFFGLVTSRQLWLLARYHRRMRHQARLLHLAHDAILVTDPSFTILEWNEGAERTYGWTSDQAIGRHKSELLRTERSADYEAMHAALTVTSHWEGELVHRARDGRRVIVACTVVMERDALGAPVSILIINREITEQKQASEALARLSHQRDLVLNSAGEGIYGLDVDGKVIFINPAAEAILGYAPGELLGQSLHDLIHHHHEDGSPYPFDECPTYRTLRDGVRNHLATEVFWRPDGSSFPVEYINTPLMDGGTIVGVVGTFQDITERLALSKMKDEFISVVSHELRTPLTSMRGSLGLLVGGRIDAASDRAKRMLDIAVTNTDRLIRLINDILDIERIDSGTATMQRRDATATDLMGQAADDIRPMAEKAGIDLVVEVEPADLWVDPDRIVQVLTNLLSNAVKFSPAGSRVTLRNTVRQDAIAFHVIDQGRGIPQDKREVVFERFQQVDASDARDKGGTGLGLAISRSIVLQHGGRLEVESVLGEGSTFLVTLPLQNEQTPQGVRSARARVLNRMLEVDRMEVPHGD